MLNLVIAAVACMSLGPTTLDARPVETPVPTQTVSTVIVETETPRAPTPDELAVEIPESDPEDARDLAALDAAAEACGFEVADPARETIRTYAKTTETDSVKIYLYPTSAFVSHVSLDAPDVLDGGFAFGVDVSGDVVTCLDGFDLVEIMTEWA